MIKPEDFVFLTNFKYNTQDKSGNVVKPSGTTWAGRVLATDVPKTARWSVYAMIGEDGNWWSADRLSFHLPYNDNGTLKIDIGESSRRVDIKWVVYGD